jgi:membrane-bound lytic murein transglycosylase A
MIIKNLISTFILSISLNCIVSEIVWSQQQPLKPITINNNNLGFDSQLWGNSGHKGDRQALIQAINYSLRFLQTQKAIEVYQNYPIPEITRERVIASLKRFRQLVQQSSSPSELQQAVAKEFIFYQSVGSDNLGTVSFTGYFQPISE